MIKYKIILLWIVYCTFLHHVSSFLCEIACSNKRPEDTEVIKAKNLTFSDVMLNENEAALLLFCEVTNYKVK